MNLRRRALKMVCEALEVPCSPVHKYCILIISLLFLYDYVFYDVAPTPLVEINFPNFSPLSPYNSSIIYMNRSVYDQDDPNKLIDLKNFSFLINPNTCENFSSLLLITIVSSRPNRLKNRMVIRNTWGQNTNSSALVFLFGEVRNETLSNAILNESATYVDIVQGEFKDSYRNLTYKHAMGLKWVSTYCPKARYILKTDDDIFVNTYELSRFLTRSLSPWGVTDLIFCPVFLTAKVQRTGKWAVTTKEYADDNYPVYCAGWGILYSQDVVRNLLSAVQNLPVFWIDDIHVTGTAAKQLGIPRTDMGKLVMSIQKANSILKRGYVKAYDSYLLFGPFDLKPKSIEKIWNAVSVAYK